MTKKSLFYAFLVFFITLIPNISNAAEVVFGTDITFNSETVAENYYITAGNLDIDSIFEKDLIVAAGKMDIRGEVKGDAVILGGEINLTNYVSGDLRIFGGVVNLSSTIDGDLIIIGGEVYLNEDAEIRGETIIIGGEIKQNSPLDGKSTIVAAAIFLNSDVSTTTSVTTQNITFESGANITGNLNYYAPEKAFEREGSKITGNITFNEIETIRETGIVKTTIINVLSFWIILKFITTLVIAFILVHLFKVFSQRVTDIATGSFIKSLLIGILSLVCVPLTFLVLMVSLIGLPIGLMLVLIYMLIISLSGAISGIIIGQMVSEMLGKNDDKKVKFNNTVVGIILLTTLQFINILGDITIAVFALVSIGSVVVFIFRSVFKK